MSVHFRPLRFLPILTVLATISPLQAAAEQILPVFDFSTTEAARLAWHPSTTSPPVGIFPGIADLESSGTVFPCEFIPEQSRCYWDRAITADLSVESVVSLRVFVADPAPVASLTLYFQSPGGWYAFSTSVDQGWQTLRAPIGAFRIEGTPAGWDQIIGIRFSPWKAAEGRTRLIATQLRAYTPPVTIVQGTRNLAEQDPAPYVDTITSILDDLDIDYTLTTDDEVDAGNLPGKLAILPYNTNLSTNEIARLQQFVAGGGKLMVFYIISSPLASTLGVQLTGWTRISLGGMRFTPGLVECVPDRADQASWNITLAQPAGPATQILARWENPQRIPLEHAAWLLHPNGAFMTHVLLSDDIERKRQLLLALIAHFVPELKTQSARRIFDLIARVGPYSDFDTATHDIRADAAVTPRMALVDDYLASATLLRATAYAALQSESFCDSIEWSNHAHDALLEAFYYAQHPQISEFRAAWNHSGTGAYPGDWDRSAQNLADNGFNAVFPNMLWGGLAHYDSALLPHSSEFEQYGDQITAAVEACHAHGIQVHVWKVNWNLLRAPADFVQALRDQKRTQVDVDGNLVDWLCLSNPLNYQLELDSLLEVATQYDVDGIHFDYIRYPNEQTCYCTPCRQRFEADTGLTVADWPTDCYSGTLKDAYRDWRAAQITRLVRGVHDAVKAVRPNVKISAAVFSSYPACRTSVGQDWADWVDKGYLDFLCPMDYTESDSVFRGRVTSQIAIVNGRIPIYPGVGVTASSSALTPDRTIAQLRIVRELGLDGFILFNYSPYLAETQLPQIHKGFTADPPLAATFLVR